MLYTMMDLQPIVPSGRRFEDASEALELAHIQRLISRLSGGWEHWDNQRNYWARVCRKLAQRMTPQDYSVRVRRVQPRW